VRISAHVPSYEIVLSTNWRVSRKETGKSFLVFIVVRLCTKRFSAASFIESAFCCSTCTGMSGWPAE